MTTTWTELNHSGVTLDTITSGESHRSVTISKFVFS